MSQPSRACIVSIQVDGKQRYLFETDKLQEMLGASRILGMTVEKARQLFVENHGLHLLSPVSGEIRAWAEIEKKVKLLSAAWELKKWLHERGIEHTVAYEECDSEHLLEESGDLSALIRGLSQRAGRRRQMRSGEDARPTCSLFAPCRIHPFDVADEWRTDPDRDKREERRNQRGFRARAKYKEWRSAKEGKFFERHLLGPIRRRVEEFTGKPIEPDRPIDFRDLAADLEEGTADSQFIGFICADADGMGRILPKLTWNSAAWQDAKKPWERNAWFAETFDACVQQAFADAVARIVVPDPPAAEEIVSAGEVVVPVLPQLMGGDDLWAVARRDVAIPLAIALSEDFAVLANRDLAPALRVAGEDPERRPLTISVGVAFAKAGLPAFAMAESAEWLMREGAKRLKRGLVPHRGPVTGEGAIDWHWIESSVAEPVGRARQGWAYRAEDLHGAREDLLLTTRPWTISQCRTVLEQARLFAGIGRAERVPRRKREQLEEILRLGRPLSELAWESWWKGLRPGERDVVATIAQNLGLPVSSDRPSPWRKVSDAPGARVWETPFLDLLSLSDVFVDQPTRKEVSGA